MLKVSRFHSGGGIILPAAFFLAISCQPKTPDPVTTDIQDHSGSEPLRVISAASGEPVEELDAVAKAIESRILQRRKLERTVEDEIIARAEEALTAEPRELAAEN